MRDDRERFAHEKGLQYVGLDGSVGIIANGAGLAMSTVDIVNQVGGTPANFLDIGGGANADVMAGALEVINSDANVRSIFINIFGGITKGEEVANGIVQALERVQIDAPIVIRLDGTNAEEGRAILEPHLSDRLHIAAHHARRRPQGRRAREVRSQTSMAIFVDETTKVVYQGLTGSQGRFYGLRNRDVRHAGRRGHEPEEGRHRRRRHPGLRDRRRRARRRTGATASCIFIPAPGVKDAVIEAAEAGIEFIVVITEGVPAHDEAWFFNKLQQRLPEHAAARPELPRHHQPRQVQHRHHRRAHRHGGRAGRHREPLRARSPTRRSTS